VRGREAEARGAEEVDEAEGDDRGIAAPVGVADVAAEERQEVGDEAEDGVNKHGVFVRDLDLVDEVQGQHGAIAVVCVALAELGQQDDTG